MRFDHHRAASRIVARTPRALAAVVGVAGALTLSACGQLEGLTTDEPCGSPTAGCVQMPSDTASAEPSGPSVIMDQNDGGPGAGDGSGAGEGSGDDGSGGSGGGGDEASGDGASGGQTTAGPDDDEIRTESLAGDDSIEIDEDGNGVVPAAALEADIEDLFVNKYGIDVTGVDCNDDMKIYAFGGSQSCDIHTEARTYFGTIGVRGFEGDMVKYELYFPGLEPDALDL